MTKGSLSILLFTIGIGFTAQAKENCQIHSGSQGYRITAGGTTLFAGHFAGALDFAKNAISSGRCLPNENGVANIVREGPYGTSHQKIIFSVDDTFRGYRQKIYNYYVVGSAQKYLELLKEAGLWGVATKAECRLEQISPRTWELFHGPDSLDRYNDLSQAETDLQGLRVLGFCAD